MKIIAADTVAGLYQVTGYADIDQEYTAVTSSRFIEMFRRPFTGTIAAEITDQEYSALDNEYTITPAR